MPQLKIHHPRIPLLYAKSTQAIIIDQHPRCVISLKIRERYGERSPEAWAASRIWEILEDLEVKIRERRAGAAVDS
jgi:hypothetical protein